MEEQNSGTDQKVIITLGEVPEQGKHHVNIEMTYNPPIKDESLQAIMSSASPPVRLSATILRFLQVLGSAKASTMLGVLEAFHNELMNDDTAADECKEDECCGGSCHREDSEVNKVQDPA